MVFSSLIFVCVFLPVTLVIYYIIPKKFRNYFLLFASLFFYAWGGTKYVFLLLILSLTDYVLGLLIHKYQKYGKIFLILGVVTSILILGYYKYFNFVAANLNDFLGLKLVVPDVILPIGISFYIFQGLSYLIDVYRYENNRGNVDTVLQGCMVQKNPMKLILYISLFPQLIAGPIVRYRDVSGQITEREHSVEKISAGLERFSYGLAKKVLIADVVGLTADKIFALGSGYRAVDIAWIGALCYTMQIYFDFSGYSDMAIGLAKLFGFDFLENFNYPYISKSITEFWRRWHISLSSWFRDYVYIPLGGNRRGNVYLNLFIVFLLTGIWHGAEWTFILWGIWYGIFIVLERKIKNSRFGNKKLPAMIKWIYTMTVVIFGWVLFRADTFPDAVAYFADMLGLSEVEFSPFTWRYYLDNKVLFIITAAFVLSFLPIKDWMKRVRQKKAGEIMLKGFSILLLSLCFLTLVNNAYSPFIYFRF